MKKIGIWVGEKVHAIDYDTAAKLIIEKVQQFIREVKENPNSSLRLRINKTIEKIAEGLANNDPKYVGFVKTVQSKLIENTELKSIILQSLQQFKITVLDELRNNDTELMKWVGEHFDSTMQAFRSDTVIQQQVDDWCREYLKELIRENHSKIADLVHKNIEELSDSKLVELIENNVGNELQYIRLNGAIVGGFAGLVFRHCKNFYLSCF